MRYGLRAAAVLLLALSMTALFAGCKCPPLVITYPATPTPAPQSQGCDSITARGTHFDAFADFSASSDPVPNGAWRYGSTDSLGGSFDLYTVQGTLYSQVDPSIPLSMWMVAPGQVDPNVIKNESGTDMYSNAGNWVYHPAATYLHFHPGAGGQYSVVRWTCPVGGNYQVDSAFRSLRVGGPNTTADVHVLVDNSPVFNTVINAHYADGEFPYKATLALHACDTVDFTVGYGDNHEYSYDSSGIRAVIDRK